MPVAHGNMKVSKLTLQGNGAYNNSDLVMAMADSVFTMSMGSNVLMSVAPPEYDETLANEAVVSDATLTIVKDTVIDGKLTVNEDVTVTQKLTVNTVNGIPFDNVSQIVRPLITTSGLSNAVKDIVGLSTPFGTGLQSVFTQMATQPAPIKKYVGSLTNAVGSTAEYVIDVPPNFNGTVALYSHGYRFSINFNPYTGAPLPTNNAGQSMPTAFNLAISPMREFLLDLGVAVMGSGFSHQGYNTVKAVQDNIALINYFKTLYPSTKKVMAWGDSLGGNITQATAEARPDLIDSVGLMDVAYDFPNQIRLAGDVLWFFKTVFNSNIQISDFSSDTATRTYQILSSTASVISILTSASTANTWSIANTPVAQTLAGMGYTPATAITMVGGNLGMPLKSAHYGGSTSQLIGGAVMENIGESAALAVSAIADMEQRVGGTVYDNTATNYAGKSNVMWGGQDAPLMSVLEAAPRQVGLCNLTLVEESKLDRITGYITKPTVVMCAQYDHITPYVSLLDLNASYNSNLALGIVSSNMLLNLVAYPPISTWANATSAPAVRGTAHGNFSSNNYVLVASLMTYGAYTGSNLSLTDVALLNNVVSNCDSTAPLLYGSNQALLDSFSTPQLSYFLDS